MSGCSDVLTCQAAGALAHGEMPPHGGVKKRCCTTDDDADAASLAAVASTQR